MGYSGCGHATKEASWDGFLGWMASALIRQLSRISLTLRSETGCCSGTCEGKPRKAAQNSRPKSTVEARVIVLNKGADFRRGIGSEMPPVRLSQATQGRTDCCEGVDGFAAGERIRGSFEELGLDAGVPPLVRLAVQVPRSSGVLEVLRKGSTQARSQ